MWSRTGVSINFWKDWNFDIFASGTESREGRERASRFVAVKARTSFRIWVVRWAAIVAAAAGCRVGFFDGLASRFVFRRGEGRFVGSQYPFVFVVGCLSSSGGHFHIFLFTM